MEIKVKILHHDGRIEYRNVSPWDVYINSLDLKTLKCDSEENILVFDYAGHPKNKGTWFGQNCKFIDEQYIGSEKTPKFKTCMHGNNLKSFTFDNCDIENCPINKGSKK